MLIFVNTKRIAQTRIRSFNKLDDYLENKDFKKLGPQRMKLPRIGAIRESLKSFEIDRLVNIHDKILKKSNPTFLLKSC
jgi:hypothetical protein